MNTNDTQQLTAVITGKDFKEAWEQLYPDEGNPIVQLLGDMKVAMNGTYRLELYVSEIDNNKKEESK